jgi:hypothetical protein
MGIKHQITDDEEDEKVHGVWQGSDMQMLWRRDKWSQAVCLTRPDESQSIEEG